MNQHVQFGGGVSYTTMVPVVLAATLASALLVLILPRKYAIYPILFTVLLTPFGEALYFGGLHFFALRIIILAGCLRMLIRTFLSSESLFAGGFQSFDKLFSFMIGTSGIAFILLYREGGAVIGALAFCLDSFGTYFLFRHLVRDKEDIVRIIKAFAIIVAILAPSMVYEHLMGFNFFNYISYWPLVPLVREHGFRAQSIFGNSITAGSFGAILLPLFFWLLKSGKARLFGVFGMACATAVVISSVAATGVMAWIAGIVAIFLWPLRKQMRLIRWGIAGLVVALALIMKAPVWFVIARIDVVSGHGWDRANLIQQFMTHFSDWWLVGAKDNAAWGYDTWDACNEFVAAGLGGGLLGLTLFVALLSKAFSMIGKARKRVQGTAEEWFFWCLGAALFANLMAFLGIDYFDSLRVSWYAFLAMVSAATVLVPVADVSPERASMFRWTLSRTTAAGATSNAVTTAFP